MESQLATLESPSDNGADHASPACPVCQEQLVEKRLLWTCPRCRYQICLDCDGAMG
jgi:hypothetical protein